MSKWFNRYPVQNNNMFKSIVHFQDQTRNATELSTEAFRFAVESNASIASMDAIATFIEAASAEPAVVLQKLKDVDLAQVAISQEAFADWWAEKQRTILTVYKWPSIISTGMFKVLSMITLTATSFSTILTTAAVQAIAGIPIIFIYGINYTVRKVSGKWYGLSYADMLTFLNEYEVALSAVEQLPADAASLKTPTVATADDESNLMYDAINKKMHSLKGTMSDVWWNEFDGTSLPLRQRSDVIENLGYGSDSLPTLFKRIDELSDRLYRVVSAYRLDVAELTKDNAGARTKAPLASFQGKANRFIDLRTTLISSLMDAMAWVKSDQLLPLTNHYEAVVNKDEAPKYERDLKRFTAELESRK